MVCVQREHMANGESVGGSSVDNTTFNIPDTGGSGCDVFSTRGDEGLADDMHDMMEESLPSIGGLSEQALTVHEQSIRSGETLDISSNGITQSNSGSNHYHSDHELTASRPSFTPCHNTPESAYASCYQSRLCSVGRGFIMDSRSVSRDPLYACTRAAKVRIALCSVICFICFIAAMVLFMIDASESDIQLAGAVLLIIALMLLSLTLYDAMRHHLGYHPYQANHSHTDSRIPQYFPQWHYQMQCNRTSDAFAATNNCRNISDTDQDLVPIGLLHTDIDSPPSYEAVVRQPSLYPQTTTEVSPVQHRAEIEEQHTVVQRGVCSC